MKPNSTPAGAASRPGRTRPGSGFTLVEMIGVLAILAILLSAATVAVLKIITEQRRKSEADSLKSIAEALPARIRRTMVVPSASTWGTFLVDELALPLARVTTTRLGNPRVLAVDPAAVLGPVGGTLGLPYTQTGAGAVQPSSLRMVLVSSAGPPLPSLSSVAFADLWATVEGTTPAGWPGTWTGDGADLLLQRIELGGVFHRLVLSNVDPTNAAVWSISGTTNLEQVACNTRRELWIIDTSALSLYNRGPVLGVREVLRSDASYVYENGRWYHHVERGVRRASCGPFGDLVDAFLAAARRTGAAEANPQMVADSLFHFLMGFRFWSVEGGCSSVLGYWSAPRNQLNNFRGHLDDAAQKLE